eukprot:7760155-Pyramimonas_sp.AAC.1
MRRAMRVRARRTARRARCTFARASVSTAAQPRAERATAATRSIPSHPPGNCARACEGHRACECERVEKLRRLNVRPSMLRTGGRAAPRALQRWRGRGQTQSGE